MGRFAIISICSACSFTAGVLPGDAGDGGLLGDTLLDAGQCVAASTECVGDTLRVCSGEGATAVDIPCSWGCDTIAMDRCLGIVPAANGVLAADLLPAPTLVDLVLGDDSSIDTGDGRIGTLADPDLIRPGGTEEMNGIAFEVRNGVGVVRVKSLTVSASAANPLTFQFTNAIAIVADGPIVIDGVIDVRSTCVNNSAGPGGFVGGTNKGPGDGPGGGGANATNDYAGGGGGYGGTGGTGAFSTPAMTTTGGSRFGDDTITMLVGGGGGGGGAGGGAAVGGGGGGALQLVSNHSITIMSGGINAGGCGGETKGGSSDGGGGGGAGGTILLEAPTITIAGGTLAVNGGGGGAGDGPATRGQPGQLSRTPAAGDVAGIGDGGNGGDGAAGAMRDGSPGGVFATQPGGGGGGGLGRIRLNTRGNTGLSINAAAILSPHLDDASSCTRGATVVQ